MSARARKALAKVGTIEVKIYEMSIGREVYFKPTELEMRHRIPEKAIKGKSLSLSIA